MTACGFLTWSPALQVSSDWAGFFVVAKVIRIPGECILHTFLCRVPEGLIPFSVLSNLYVLGWYEFACARGQTVCRFSLQPVTSAGDFTDVKHVCLVSV